MQARVSSVLSVGLTPGVLALVIAGLLVIAGAFLGASMARFRRSQLILD